jgi:heptosyltransferase-2
MLVRATNWVGDAIMSLPALLAIRTRFPNTHISLLARPWVAGIYGTAVADEIIPYESPRGWRDLTGKLAVARELRRRQFDCAILLQNAFEAAALAFAAGIPRRIGFDRDGRGWLLTEAVSAPRPGEIPPHQRFYYLELLRRAGIIEDLPPAEAIRLPDAAERRESGLRLFAEQGFPPTVVGVSPGAAYGNAKRWLPERFAESAIRLARELSSAVAVFGSSDEAHLCDSVAGQIRRGGVEACSFAGRTTVGQFADYAAACTMFLTNDSGAMHIASALGVPTVAIFGATDEIATGPTGPLSRVVKEPVECSPCLLRECPIDHRCMTRVSSEQVVRAAQELVRLRGQ